MRARFHRCCLLVGVVAATAAAEPKSLAVPALTKTPSLDGNGKALAPGAVLKSLAAEKGKSTFIARAGYRKDTLYVAVEVSADKVSPEDVLALSLHFPDAGPTAPGYTFAFGPSGSKPTTDPATPKYAVDSIHAKAKTTPKGFSLEAALPPLALPRWPAREPMVLELCVRYAGHDEGEDAAVSNCEGGSMAIPLRLPDDFRKAFKLKYPDKLVAVERRENGWAGYGALSLPLWIQGDADLTAEAVAAFVTDHPVDPEAVHVPFPPHMAAPDGRTVVPLLTGQDPYAVADQCDMSKEVRLGLYAYRGKVANRVLEWTAANCALGRAASVVLGEDGALSIGYTNGVTTTFTWSGDHFEQTQLGER